MAELLGSLFERTGDPAAALSFLRALDRTEHRQVRAALELLARTRPVAVEVVP